jgi:hypothetical protein
MGVRRDKVIEVDGGLALVVPAIEQALQSMGAQVLFSAPEQGSFSARTSATIWSFGEQVNIVTEAAGAGRTIVRVSSENGQLIDWGKNAQNLERFEQALFAAIVARPAATRPAERPAPPHVSRAVPTPVATPEAKRSGRRVFVSYRRDDSSTIVGRLCDRLAQDVGADNVFKDIDSIPFGVDFVTYLDREVEKCSVLFAVIGPAWLEADPQGARRIDDPNDFVRLEIGSALRREIPVVPLLVEGARMPRASDLPDDLKPWARRNGIEIRHDPDFHADVSRLLSRLGS